MSLPGPAVPRAREPKTFSSAIPYLSQTAARAASSMSRSGAIRMCEGYRPRGQASRITGLPVAWRRPWSGRAGRLVCRADAWERAECKGMRMLFRGGPFCCVVHTVGWGDFLLVYGKEKVYRSIP